MDNTLLFTNQYIKSKENDIIILSKDWNFDKIHHFFKDNLIDSQIDRLERSEIIRSALKENGLIIKIDSLDQSLRLINILAPEHLHIAFANNNKIDTSQVVAGIILEGPDSAVSLSDYVLGPSHILPTNSSSRFSSPLSVEDFMVSSSHVSLKYETNPDLYIKYVENTSIIARAEGLTAHAISVEKRKKV